MRERGVAKASAGFGSLGAVAIMCGELDGRFGARVGGCNDVFCFSQSRGMLLYLKRCTPPIMRTSSFYSLICIELSWQAFLVCFVGFFWPWCVCTRFPLC